LIEIHKIVGKQPVTNNSTTGEPKADILIVDDTPDNLRLLNQILSQYYKVRLAPSGAIGLAAARSTPPDLILLDIMMPAMNGYEVAAQLKADKLTEDVPIIFMSALDDTDSKVRGFTAGGIDYVTKPFQEVEVLARVRTHMSVRSLYKQAQAEIVERKRVENELRESESRNRALLSAVPDMMYRIRRDGVFLDYKASTSNVLFAAPEQIIGAQVMKVLEKNLALRFMDCVDEVLDTKEIQTMEYTLKTEDSSHVYEARFKDSGADEVTVIIRDISDRARLEQMKSDFINRATHELRTPIATMLLMVNLIDGDSTPEEFKEFWEVLKNEIHREHMLVENLLNVGRLESGRTNMHLVPVDVGKLLEKVVTQFELPARDKNVSISLRILLEQADKAIVKADENALTQVFVNLLGNAVKFTPSGGSTEIVVQQNNLGVDVSFRDTGIGIPSEDLPLMFTRFFRGTNAIENEIPGTGIGLFIVQSIVEKHGGNIKVHSEIGKGSQFDVWLPAQNPIP
jgi:PAS domain S-box-containing protein